MGPNFLRREVCSSVGVWVARSLKVLVGWNYGIWRNGWVRKWGECEFVVREHVPRVKDFRSGLALSYKQKVRFMRSGAFTSVSALGSVSMSCERRSADSFE